MVSHLQEETTEDPYGLWQLTIEFYNDMFSWTKLIGTEAQVREKAEEMVRVLDLIYIVGYSLEELIYVPLQQNYQFEVLPIEEKTIQLI